MSFFGRCHLVRVVLAFILTVLVLAIYNEAYRSGYYFRVDTRLADMPLDEIDKLSRANETCPACFGRDACPELMADVARGVIRVGRTPVKPENTADVVYEVHRRGQMKFWMRAEAPRPSLMRGFESYICRAASSRKFESSEGCDVSAAAKLLHSSNLDLDAIRNLYKTHLMSRRRIPITICPSWKLVQALVQSFDDNDDQTLTADEKATLLTTLATNPEIAAYKLILHQKLQIPVLPYYGACGRLTFFQGPYKPLSDFIKEPLPVRVYLAYQLLQMVDAFLNDESGWLLFTRDLSYDNLVVTTINQVMLRDLSHVFLIDKDMLPDEPDSSANGECNDECFDEFYEDLVGVSRADYKDQCARVSLFADHMFSLVCQLVLSDLEPDKKHRRTNPLAKLLPGLLHNVNEIQPGDERPLFEDADLINSLLSRCSGSASIDARKEAALQLMEELALVDDEDEAEDKEEEDDDDDDEEEDRIGDENLGPDDYAKAQDQPDDATKIQP